MSVTTNLVAHGPSYTLATLEDLHKELMSVLQQAQQPSSSDEPPTTRMQILTGCSRREAQYYLQQVMRLDYLRCMVHVLKAACCDAYATMQLHKVYTAEM